MLGLYLASRERQGRGCRVEALVVVLRVGVGVRKKIPGKRMDSKMLVQIWRLEVGSFLFHHLL